MNTNQTTDADKRILASRRSFIRQALFVPASLLVAGRFLGPHSVEAAVQPLAPSGPFTLPPLSYKFDDLEPYIDAMTMEIHHDRHHAGYVKNLNEAVAKAPELAGKSAEDLLKNLKKVPELVRTAVRNNAGGHVNHTMFWTLMMPGGGGEPTGAIADAIKGTFGSFAAFQTAFDEAGTKRFGSGWVWLVQNKKGKLEIITTPNQDSPFLAEYNSYPILGNDVWEHAYYLKYQNKRADYLKAWWNVINWDKVNQRLTMAKMA